MKPADADLRRWSLKRWSWNLLLVLAVQVCTVLLLSQYPGGAKSPAPVESRASLVNPKIETEFADYMRLRDPMLFAAPNPNGFSGAAWLQEPQFNYRMTNWKAPVPWSPPPISSLGHDFARFVKTNVSPSPVSVRKPDPDSWFEPAPLPPLMSQAGSFSLEGPLASRPLLSHGPVPAGEPGKVLPATVVRLICDARGYVLSGAVTRSSGSQSNDRDAVRFASTLRFAPADTEESDPVTGWLVVRWLGSSPDNGTTNR